MVTEILPSTGLTSWLSEFLIMGYLICESLRAAGFGPCRAYLCRSRIVRLNQRGPEWAAQNINRIVGWMQQNADADGVDIDVEKCRQAVLAAIDRARLEQKG